MGFAKQWKGVNAYMIRDPNRFFSNYNERHGVGYPLAFMLVSFVVAVLPVMGVLTVLNLTSPGEAALTIVAVLVLAVLFWIGAVVEALVAHLIASYFGTETVVLTLEAYAFPTLVRYGLWWFPIANLGLGLYGLYLQIKGLASFHDLSTGQAAVSGVLAALLSSLVVGVGTVLLAAVLGAFLLDLGGGQPPA